jgi:hypothetical protein
VRKIKSTVLIALACAGGAVGCARAVDGGRGGTGGGGVADLAVGGGGSSADLGADLVGGDTVDLGGGGGAAADLAGGGGAADLASAGAHDLATSNIISGGPCLSGAAGATAIRVRWTSSAGTATVQYEAFGMPDHAREKVGAYGYQIGFSPSFVDQFLGDGGLLLDGSDFVDIELSGAGIASISSATLALYGRSYDTTTDGSFSWMSISDSGATASDFVSNVAPYHWYAGDLGDTVAAGDANVLVRIKAGPSSGALVVNRIEICLAAH